MKGVAGNNYIYRLPEIIITLLTAVNYAL